MVAQLDAPYREVGLGPTTVRLASWAVFEGRPLTTRGRWINPLVLGRHHLAKAIPRQPPVAPIFLMGMGRSGTTLLGRILSLHPDVGLLNEPKALWHAAIGDEDVIGSYHRGAARYRLVEDDADPRTARALQRLVSDYLFWVRRRRLLDKNPEVVYRVPFVRAIFPDARFLFLVRNGWSVCTSVATWSEQHGQTVGGERHDWWGADRRKYDLLVEQLVAGEEDLAPYANTLAGLEDQRLMAAVEWIVSCRWGLRELEASSDTVRLVRYESLLADPTGELEDLMSWCGLSDSQRVLDYANRVAKPPRQARPFDLPSALAPPFAATMDRLGYDEAATP